MSNLTISLTGSEVKVEFYGTNAWLRNDGTSTIYAGRKPSVVSGADGVVSVPAGGSAPVFDAHGTVYLTGTGSVLLIGSDYSENPFKSSAQAGGSGADEVARAAIEAHSGNSAIHLTTEQLAAAISNHNTDSTAHAGLFAAESHTHTKSEITDFPEIPELPAPTSFSVEAAAWVTLSAPFSGCGFSTEITAESVTAADFPDVYFDSASFETAANSGIIAEATDGKIVLYAKTVPEAALSGSYFIRKGAAE